MTSSDMRLPALPLGGDATLVRWLRAAGDTVSAGEPLAVVRTARAEILIPATVSGTIAALLVDEGGPISDTPLLTLAAPESAPRPPRATPLARRIASLHAVALDTLAGTGIDRRITGRDVIQFIAPATQPVAPPDAEPLAASAAPAVPDVAPAAALTDVAPAGPIDEYFAVTAMQAECGRVVAARHAARAGIAPDAFAVMVEAIAATLCAYPLLNSVWTDEGIVQRRNVDCIVARADGRAGFVAAAQDRNARGIARALHSSASGAATFAICETGGWAFAAQPFGGITTLSVSTPAATPVVVADTGGERIALRPCSILTLAYDARTIDQPYADAFLRALGERLN